MKKTLLLLVFSLVFASCSKTSTTTSSTIKFWNFGSEPAQKQALKELIAEFEKQEHCTVETTELSWNDGKMKLMAAFNSGTAPDVLELGSDWVAQFSSSGVLMEVPKDATFEKFADFARPPCGSRKCMHIHGQSIRV